MDLPGVARYVSISDFLVQIYFVEFDLIRLCLKDLLFLHVLSFIFVIVGCPYCLLCCYYSDFISPCSNLVATRPILSQSLFFPVLISVCLSGYLSTYLSILFF